MALTKDEVSKIQTGGIDWKGQPLVVDGIWGPRTAWWQGISSLGQKRQNVLRLALGYSASNIQFEKTGRNDSPFVDKLFEPVGLEGRGYPWCVSLVSFILRECEVPWPVYHVSAYRLIEWAKINNKIVDEPYPADIEVFLYPKIKGEDYKGHGRFVTAYDKKTKRTAGVDGNVQNSVFCGYRDSRPDRYFVRPDYEVLTMPTGLIDLDGLADR
jgi:hypothetical protein